MKRSITSAAMMLVCSAVACSSGDGTPVDTSTVGGAASGNGGATASGGTTPLAESGGTAAGGAIGGSEAGGLPGNSGGGVAACLGSDFLASLGKDTLLIGGGIDTNPVKDQLAIDIRFNYTGGAYPYDKLPCSSCLDCNPGWWGCWQDAKQPPGQFALSELKMARDATWNGVPRPQFAWFTYYAELTMAGGSSNEGAKQVTFLNDDTFAKAYFDAFRFLVQKIGNEKALVHIEPDLWGYVGDRPDQVPAKVSTSATECAAYEDTAAGFARCLIRLVRVHAPNAKVGLHISPWVAGFGNTDPSADVVAQAKKQAEVMVAMGASDGDFVVTDPNSSSETGKTKDRRFWDVNNIALPNFRQAFTVSKTIAETIGKPLIWWQVPVGNMSLDNTDGHYQDVFLDYVFDHPEEVVAAHIPAVIFGTGSTKATTDEGHFIAKASAYAQKGGQKYCLSH